MGSSSIKMNFRLLPAIVASLLFFAVGLRFVPASQESARPRILPAPLIESALARAREQAGGGALPAGFRLLAELSIVEGTVKPGPVALTPKVMSLLAGAGMRPFLRTLAGGPSYASSGAGAPVVTWISPGPGAGLFPEIPTSLQWTATDPDGIAFIDILASYDGGTTFLPVVRGLGGSETSLNWFPPLRPGSTLLRIEATDTLMVLGSGDQTITIQSSPVPTLLPTTLRDFDQPGTQPNEHGLDLFDPSTCATCHGSFDDDVEPTFAWSGSMMANAGRDPLFEACMVIAEQDAEGSGDLCLRCHVPKGWLEGRSTPTDGSQIQGSDRHGVSCDLCHRMVDPVYAPGQSPPEDAAILADLVLGAPTSPGGGRYVTDPTGTRRGPFADAVCDQVAHPFLTSPFHRESSLCGTCHNVSNPAYENDGMGNYVANFDQPAAGFGHGSIMPLERTYSEWLNSDYNSPGGVFAPELGGNRDFVSSCQDCHMRAVTGTGCNPSLFPTAPVRTDLPLHDLTGGNTWIPTLIDDLYPGEVDPLALADTVQRALFMLQNAAELDTFFEEGKLRVRVFNNTGHKLPSGYPEGRRIWLNVKFFDDNDNLVKESGAYDFGTAVLTEDGEAKIYETKQGLDAAASVLTGLPVGPSFHFVLNNKAYKDNRIPARGFTNAAYASFGGAPVDYSYADGQYWDDTLYEVPGNARKARVTLYYQLASKEYIEFLRDENVTDSTGQQMWDLWDQNGKCPPEVMEKETQFLYELGRDPVPPPPSGGRGIHR